MPEWPKPEKVALRDRLRRHGLESKRPVGLVPARVRKSSLRKNSETHKSFGFWVQRNLVKISFEIGDS